jgi:mono/diheme cytochrome c family protein
MKKMNIAYTIVIVVCILSCTNADRKEKRDNPKEPLSQEQLVERGKYLVRISGCGDCHSPKAMGPHGPTEDTTLLLSGFQKRDSIPVPAGSTIRQNLVFNLQNTAFAGPWGISYAANITPDATGIGNWTFEQFDRAMREGKAKGLKDNRTLLPPMPWSNYKNMEDDDMEAIFTYLKSIKPVNNLTPEPQPPTVFH